MTDDHGMLLSRRTLVQLLAAGGSAPLAAGALAAFPERSLAAPGAGARSITLLRQDGGGELTVGLDQEPPTLDPHASPSAVTFQITSSVTETLLFLTNDRQLKPWLAESWDASPDGMSFTFTLRQDVIFHDGEPFNAETVKWNFDRIVDPNFIAGGALAALSGYTGSEVIDEYTVKVNFSAPYAPFLTYAAGGTLGMVSPKAVQDLGDEFGTKIVGSGPFKVDEYNAKESVTLIRNDDYSRTLPWSERAGPPLLEKITFKFIPEPGTRVTTVETGESDLVTVIPSQDLPRLEESGDLTVTKIPWVGLPRILILNTVLAPTDDVNVRKAVSLAIDRQALVDTVFAGTGEIAIGMLTRVMLDDPSLSQPYDPEQAKLLLEQAGWVGEGTREKDGQTLTFSLNVVDYGGGAPPEAQLIQANLNDVGFECEIKAQARAPWYEDNYAGQTNGPLMFLRSGDYDGLFAMFHSSLIGNNFNFAMLNDPEIDAQLMAGRAETDPEARRQLYLALEQTLNEMAVAAPLIDEYSVWAGKASIQGLIFDGFTYPLWSDVAVGE